MNGISKLRLPKTQTALSLKKNSPKLHVWDITLVLLFQTIYSQFSVIIQLRGFLFLYQLGSVLNFCLFRLSNTLSELWVSNSHTRWH